MGSSFVKDCTAEPRILRPLKRRYAHRRWWALTHWFCWPLEEEILSWLRRCWS